MDAIRSLIMSGLSESSRDSTSGSLREVEQGQHIRQPERSDVTCIRRAISMQFYLTYLMSNEAST